jgi:hypothetical protein
VVCRARLLSRSKVRLLSIFSTTSAVSQTRRSSPRAALAKGRANRADRFGGASPRRWRTSTIRNTTSGSCLFPARRVYGSREKPNPQPTPIARRLSGLLDEVGAQYRVRPWMKKLGLGGARTHNQRLKRAIVNICKLLAVSILHIQEFFVAPFVAHDIARGQERQSAGPALPQRWSKLIKLLAGVCPL